MRSTYCAVAHKLMLLCATLQIKSERVGETNMVIILKGCFRCFLLLTAQR